jgi:hypothetical protein
LALPAGAQTERVPQGTWIAKSTFVNLADTESFRLKPTDFIYIPPGTRFLAFDKVVRRRGLDRRLILTESGLWSYIPDGDGYFWVPKRLALFSGESELAIIRKKELIEYQLSPEVTLQIWLTPSEIYEVAQESPDGIEISLGNRKLLSLGEDVAYKIKIPYSLASLIHPGTIELERRNVQAYRRSIRDNVIGVQKPCGQKNVRTIKLDGGGGFDLSKFFAYIKIDASVETTTIEDFSPAYNVTRWYYTRGDTGEVYRVTKKQDCSTGKLHYSYVSPEGFEIEFRHDRDDQKSFKFDTSGRITVTCADDYFALAEYLDEFEFKPREIPFLLSKTARFTNTHDAANCGRR